MNRFYYLLPWASNKELAGVSERYHADVANRADWLNGCIASWREQASHPCVPQDTLPGQLLRTLHLYILGDAEDFAAALTRSGFGSSRAARHALEAHLRLLIYWVRRQIWGPELNAAGISGRQVVSVLSEDTLRNLGGRLRGLPEEQMETVWRRVLHSEAMPEFVDCFSELMTREFWRGLVSCYMGDSVLDLEEAWKRDPREWGRAVDRIIREVGIPIQTKGGAGLANPRYITRRALQDIRAGRVVPRQETKKYIESFLADHGYLPRTEKSSGLSGSH